MSIHFKSCTFGYGRRKPPILKDLTYTVPDGFTVLLGPNGAGKSTLLKLGSGLHKPHSGSVSMGSLTSRDFAFAGQVAWMPQVITPMTGLTAREQVAYTGWLKGMAKSDAWDAARTALERVNMMDRADIKTKQLSGGQLRRVGVASALVHGAGILLLDEPTAGMDPTQRRAFRDLILGLATAEVRVLMSTHDVADLAEEADHVTVLQKGQIAFTGPTRDFLTHAPHETSKARRAETAYATVSTLPALQTSR
ncbi:ATP-binding cassette domain-containing protein [Streptomyces sp. BV286]|uniref:ABC transporter ATP-binding protein n=1 Tax=Streptomyces sp. BV286 TaxID=2849672 RepID=UPI001C2EF1A3|nr:ATP-binding cassette domain-containing protein [Streptomyces sp. BV286]MBV1940530.1 ATP-binding cassette domain-containing protein [Streptomyces sp. BV286]